MNDGNFNERLREKLSECSHASTNLVDPTRLSSQKYNQLSKVVSQRSKVHRVLVVHRDTYLSMLAAGIIDIISSRKIAISEQEKTVGKLVLISKSEIGTI
jgi:hypothetical protein